VGVRPRTDRQTDRHTDARDHNTFCIVYDSLTQNVIRKSCFYIDNVNTDCNALDDMTAFVNSSSVEVHGHMLRSHAATFSTQVYPPPICGTKAAKHFIDTVQQLIATNTGQVSVVFYKGKAASLKLFSYSPSGSRSAIPTREAYCPS